MKKDMLIHKAEQAESRAKRDLCHYIREAVDGADMGEVESIVEDIVTAAVSRAKAEILDLIPSHLLRLDR